ncbi:cell division protein FtsZ [Ignatzschineria sp. RMDPL8A]|uniref:cell division protein FtsZ n=1 Tax=Ignatzschineria sp. RMDPL8A TaxID=2999236 RepID=UPI00244670B6|nr:cell division protein FtsZ [Ignatzschineria sp. RMDPL8A]MDG9729948.1 cell division protein FtsZ [Ignatzschineria sp. RMDPL8A]
MSKFELHQDYSDQRPIIKIIGVGGAGGNAVTHMVESGMEGVSFIAANTDAQALNKTKAEILVQLGADLTKGLGAGADPEVGRNAALEDSDRLREVLDGANMVFIAAGMGGGTGTGAAPVIAEIARELGILTVAVVSRPFAFEARDAAANEGLKVLADHVDSLITIPNERLMTVLGKGASLIDAFKAANNVLYNAVQGITESIVQEGMINLDFNDVKTVMSQQGMAMMGVGVSSGDNRAREATQEAISSPLLDDIDLSGAKGILVNITGGPGLAIGEYYEIGGMIREFVNDDPTIIIGAAIDEELGDELRVTIIATGLGRFNAPAGRARRNTKESATTSVTERVEKAPREKSRTQDQLFTDILDIPAFLRRQSD